MIRSHFFLYRHHISPNHGKHPSEPSWTLLMHQSESCVRKKSSVVFHKLKAALLVVRPHAVKMPAKVMINTRRAVEVKQSQIICRGPRNLHFVWKWDSIKYGIDFGLDFSLLMNLYLFLKSWYCIIHALLLQHPADQQSPILPSQRPISVSHAFPEVDSVTFYPATYWYLSFVR